MLSLALVPRRGPGNETLMGHAVADSALLPTTNSTIENVHSRRIVQIGMETWRHIQA